jgi:phospholipase C
MIGARAIVVTYLLLGLVTGAAAVAPGVAHASEDVPAPKTPIKHFISLMQSNHTFDSYFGTYPGADGIPSGVCMPVDPTDPTNPDCVEPFHLENNGVDLDHSHPTFLNQYRSDEMNGFVHAFRRRGEDGTVAMGHFDDRDLPVYWNLADDYVLFDRFFSSSAGGSVPNRMFWTTGTAGIGSSDQDDIPKAGWGDLATIFDRLEARGISWKFYVQNYDPTITFRTRGTSGGTYAQFNWAPLLSYARYIDDPKLSRHIVDLDQYFEDVRSDQLPAVAYVVTIGASEHPPSSLVTGQRLVKKMVNTLAQSPAWSSSAFMLTYDDWGGWYDHVPPPQIDEFGYGFRTPALLVSPYAKQGYVDSTVLDSTSILRFIEDNYNLPPLAERDAQASGLSSAFDFTRPPREPQIVSSSREQSHVIQPRRPAIYGSYAGALLVSTAVILGSLMAGTLRRTLRRMTWRLRLGPGERGTP